MQRSFSPNKPNFEIQANLKEQKQVKKAKDRTLNKYRYFCHYNNAVYMGGMKAYKKHGKGIILHDDGSAAITEYLHDTPSGHTIIFRQNSIASIFIKNSAEIQIAYKIGKTIIKIPFNEDKSQINGNGVLIDCEEHKIYQLIFKKGVLIHKILHQEPMDNQGIFRKTILKMIGAKHDQAFSFTFERPDNMHVKFDKNLFTIGYFDDFSQIHGLAFKFYAENVLPNRGKLQLKSLERGYYNNSKLQTFGEKCFKNGNKFIGEFQKGEFQGRGILLCPSVLKWVYGKFQSNKLVDVITSNNQKQTQSEYEMWKESLKCIHKRYQQRWIDVDIELPSEYYLYQLLKNAESQEITEIRKYYESIQREDENNLSRIQTQFEVGNSDQNSSFIVDDSINKHYINKSNPYPRKVGNISNNNRVIKEQSKQSRNPLVNEQYHKIKDNQNYHLQGKTPSIFQQQALYENQNHTNQQSRNARDRYLMQDPFKIELIKISSKEEETEKDQSLKFFLIQVDKFSGGSQQFHSKQSSPINRKKQIAYQMEAINPSRPLDGVQNRNNLQKLQRRRQELKPAKYQEKQLNNKKQFSVSPVHRNYDSTPTKQVQFQKYLGKVHKRHFNYRDPTELIVHKWHQDSVSNKEYNSKDYQDYKKQSIKRNCPIQYDYQNNENSGRLNLKPNYVQHNYQYWT